MAKQSKGKSSTKTTKSTSGKLPAVNKARVEKFKKGGEVKPRKK
jgi:hypothetical protein